MTLPKAIFAGHINAMQRAPANLENNVAHDQPGAFIFIFIAFWCFISLFLSFIGGWQQLARQYKTTESPYGKAYNSQSGAVGWVSYNNCLFIRTTPNGLFIAVMFLFRIGHPTLFIPWNDIQFLKETNFLWYHTVKIGVGNPQITTMTLPKKIFDETAGGTGS